jgi:hypothetical protein
MRNITTTTNQILGILAGATSQFASPAEIDNITTLKAELRVLLRRAAYWPPEASENLWMSLGTSLFRYLPPLQSTGYTAEIAALVTA